MCSAYFEVSTRASSPGPAIPRSMGREGAGRLHDGIALSTGMFFPYRPDNPEGATHQLQLFGGILAQIAQ
ncbi:hypothetical protein WL883_19560 [Escherichia coli]